MAEYIEKLMHDMSALDDPFVVMSVGVVGCGKTTALEYVAAALDMERVSPDDIRVELTGDVLDQRKNGQVWAEAHKRVAEELTVGRSVIVDATYYKAEDRKRDTALYRAAGARTVAAALFVTPLAVARFRNISRKTPVPQHVLTRMDRTLRETPVSKKEGFDQVFIVKPQRLPHLAGSGAPRPT